MKYLAFYILLLNNIFIAAQSSVVESLHKALLEKDSAKLDKLLHKDVSYGHSNGLVETKYELYQNLKSKKIQYNSITYENLKIQNIKQIQIVRYTMLVNVDFEGKNYDLKLHCLQTWSKKGKQLKLIARQATKVTS